MRDETIVVDELLLATGRRPNVDDLGLETVDGEWLYAAGDVTGRAPLTHQGKYDPRIVGAAIGARAAGGAVDTAPWGEHVATADHAAMPQVVFTDPEVASIGRTAAQLLRRRSPWSGRCRCTGSGTRFPPTRR